MRSLLPILITIFFIASCGRKDRIPADILSKEKMQDVLWDMMRADQFLSDYVLNQDTTLVRKNESIPYYSKILALHQVSQEKFRESYYYYRARPQLMKIIMDSLSQKKLFQVDSTMPRLAIDSITPGANSNEPSKTVTPREPMKLE